MPTRPYKVCYVLSYRAPDYIRSLSLLAALKDTPNLKLYTAINRPKGILRYLDTLWKLMLTRFINSPDIYILGFRGHELFWLVKLITLGKPLIFDSLMSPYNAVHDEKKFGTWGSMLGKAVYLLEKSILQASDHILTDTTLHVNYLSATFAIARERITAVPVGAVETVKLTRPANADNESQALTETQLRQGKARLEVLFYGSFLPLHGMNIMLEAAERLKNEPIYFSFIGGKGASLETFQKIVAKKGLVKVTHVAWVPYRDLLQSVIPETDVCLGGPFGGTSQAQRVITGKTSQCLALGKATVVGRIDEELGFSDKENCLLVPQNDVNALTEALKWALAHKEKLTALGAKGQALYQEKLSVAQIRKCLEKPIEELLA